jgi:tetratricopeptide (TPR) repeat protein
VGRLVEFLKARGLDSRTLVVVVGDHGEGLGEHSERQHGSTLYNATMHVPLIVRHSGRLTPGRRVESNVSVVDLSPSVLDLAGLPDPRRITGKSFKAALLGGASLPTICYGATDEPYLNNGWSPLRSLTDGQWKFIKTTRVELYNLADDPREMHNLAEQEADRTRSMAVQLELFESRLVERSEALVQLSGRERQALAGLGYAGGAHPALAGAMPENLPDVKDMLPYDVAAEDAVNLGRNGSVDATIERLREIVREAPLHTDARLYLAGALRDKMNFREAEQVLRDLLKLRPECSPGHAGLAAVLMQDGRTDEAFAEWELTTELDPDNAEAHYNLAKLHLAAGRPLQAQDHFNAALEIDRQHVAARQWRANLLSRQGRGAEAIDDYRQVLKYAPQLPEAHHNLGVLLAEQGLAEEAQRHLARAVELSPQSAQFHYALGVFLVQQREFGEAERHLEKALELKPGYQAADEALHEARRGRKQPGAE